MDNFKQTRSCIRDCSRSESLISSRGSKQMCIPMNREQYEQIWKDSQKVRKYLDSLLRESPELFPSSVQQGYRLTGRLSESKKMPGIRLRQLRTIEGVYSLRPSFVLSYMSGTVERLEPPLLLLSMGVPCWVVTKIFSQNDMFWQRHLERLGWPDCGRYPQTQPRRSYTPTEKGRWQSDRIAPGSLGRSPQLDGPLCVISARFR